jgi:hypothetical protein
MCQSQPSNVYGPGRQQLDVILHDSACWLRYDAHMHLFPAVPVRTFPVNSLSCSCKHAEPP